jgi:hypothetical protein
MRGPSLPPGVIARPAYMTMVTMTGQDTLRIYLKSWTLQPGGMAAVHPSMILCRDSTMAAAYITACPVYLHGVRQPCSAGAMPFRKLTSS